MGSPPRCTTPLPFKADAWCNRILTITRCRGLQMRRKQKSTLLPARKSRRELANRGSRWSRLPCAMRFIRLPEKESAVCRFAARTWPNWPFLMLFFVSLLVLTIWIVVFFAWGNFWRVWEFDSDRVAFPALQFWPRVTAVIPARNEAASIEAVVRALALQDYPGEFFAIIVDDHSEDSTAEIAQGAVRQKGGKPPVRVISCPQLRGGWTG